MKICGWTRIDEGGFAPSFPLSELSGIDLYTVGCATFPSVHGEVKGGLTSSPDNFAACVNEAAHKAQAGLLITLPPDLVGLPEGWRARLEKAAAENPKGVFFYGDYLTDSTPVSVRKDIGDITEREDWGPVWAVRVEWLLKEGGLDEIHHRAAFYDLLLKSWGKNRRIHVGGALAVVPAPVVDAKIEEQKSKLFFPGRGALGGFSYLFMDKETEHHTEEVFYNFLRRHKAWLEGPRTSTPPRFSGGDTGGAKVSVVTPVYNRAKFIGKAIESVQRADISDWEYVIVDNGSTDNTRDVVREYMKSDPR
ncbi:glycosyltransferase, partial [bacterium]|nr:glycosyltransferase [bacterium]